MARCKGSRIPCRRWRATGEQAEPNPFFGSNVERSKPIVLPLGKRVVRQADGAVGKGRWRKRRPSCNEADRDCNIIPRESGQTSIWSFITRELGELTEKAKQMTAEMSRTAGAAFHEVDWHAIDWHKAHENVGRLQARIVKAMQEVGRCKAASRKGRLKGLSRIRRKFYVQFSGGGAAATPPCYPAGGGNPLPYRDGAELGKGVTSENPKPGRT